MKSLRLGVWGMKSPNVLKRSPKTQAGAEPKATIPAARKPLEAAHPTAAVRVYHNSAGFFRHFFFLTESFAAPKRLMGAKALLTTFSNETGRAITDRQVTLRSLTAFSLIASR